MTLRVIAAVRRNQRILLLFQLGLQESAKVGGAGGRTSFSIDAVESVAGFNCILSLDGELDGTVLAVDGNDQSFNSLSFRKTGGCIFYTVGGDFAGAEVAFNIVAEVDDGALGVNGLDGAGDDSALFVAGGKAAEWIAAHLLDAEADAFTFGVDAENDGFEFIALLVLADGFFARFVPGKVGEVNKTVDSAWEADEYAEVGDGLDLAGDLVALLMGLSELFPWVDLALLHAEADAAAFFVDFENHDFDFIAELNNLARVDVLVGPVHFGNVDEAFDSGFDFNEGTVVGDVGDLAEEAGALRVAAGDSDPWVFTELLQAEGDAVLFLIELENLGGEFLADGNDFGRMANAAPCEVGDVEKAVDAAEVNECTVVGDVLNDTLDDGTFLEGFKELGAFFAHRSFNNSTAGNDDVVALAVELDDLEFEGVAFVWGRVLDRTGVDEGAWEEGADAVGHDGEAALDLAGDGTGNEFARFESLFEVHPCSEALCLVAAEDGVAVAVFNGFDGDGDEVARLDGNFTAVVLEFFDRHVGFALKTSVNDDEVVVNANDFGGDDFALTHFRLLEGFFKKLGKRFGLNGFVRHEFKKESWHTLVQSDSD